MNTLDGTESTAELLLETENVNPPDGATPEPRLMRNSVVAPLASVVGVAVTVPNDGCTATLPVEFNRTANPGLAPMIGKPISGLPSRLKSPETIVPPPTLELGGGTA